MSTPNPIAESAAHLVTKGQLLMHDGLVGVAIGDTDYEIAPMPIIWVNVTSPGELLGSTRMWPANGVRNAALLDRQTIVQTIHTRCRVRRLVTVSKDMGTHAIINIRARGRSVPIHVSDGHMWVRGHENESVRPVSRTDITDFMREVIGC